MFDLSKIPESIQKRVVGQKWIYDSVGQSEATILIYDNMVLKIEDNSSLSQNELKLLYWLKGKLPVPMVIEAVQQYEYSFILMSRLEGEIARSDNNIKNMPLTINLMVKALKMLWAVDINDCPCKNDLSQSLEFIKYKIENNAIDERFTDVSMFKEAGFSSLTDLYNFLYNNRPSEDLVFSQGDFCLPNVFISSNSVTGFIDLGCGGVNDRYQDIASFIRSLKINYKVYGKYGENEYKQYRKMFLDYLNIDSNDSKLHYYFLLNELF